MPSEPKHEESVVPENCQTAYFNGFSMAIGTGDVVIALQLNGKPILVLNTSYTVAKTMAEGLSKIISELEKKTNIAIMTTQIVAAALTKEPDQDLS